MPNPTQTHPFAGISTRLSMSFAISPCLWIGLPARVCMLFGAVVRIVAPVLDFADQS